MTATSAEGIMKTISFALVSCVLLVLSSRCFGQDSTAFQSVFRSGISLQASTGYLAIRDEHISKEKYDGPVSGVGLQWSRYHETYSFRVAIFYQKASTIKNFNISAKLSQGVFSFVNRYPAGTFGLFDKNVFVALGPAVDILFYSRQQHIAQNPNDGLDIYRSSVWLCSLGGRGEAILVFDPKIQIEGAMQLSLLSLGGGSGSSSNSSTSLRFLTVFAGMHGATEFGLRYFPIHGVTLRAGCSFDMLRINSWNYILASSDNVFLSIAYLF
jgi:hypothetical protein